MIPYEHRSLLLEFNKDMRHFSLINSNNILTSSGDKDIYIKQLNGHVEALKDIKNHEKLLDNRITHYNDSFLRFRPLYNTFKLDAINERFRPNLPNISDIKMISDPLYRYHLSIAGKHEKEILKHYAKLEDEYYSNLFVQYNIEEPDE